MGVRDLQRMWADIARSGRDVLNSAPCLRQRWRQPRPEEAARIARRNEVRQDLAHDLHEQATERGQRFLNAAVNEEFFEYKRVAYRYSHDKLFSEDFKWPQTGFRIKKWTEDGFTRIANQLHQDKQMILGNCKKHTESVDFIPGKEEAKRTILECDVVEY